MSTNGYACKYSAPNLLWETPPPVCDFHGKDTKQKWHSIVYTIFERAPSDFGKRLVCKNKDQNMMMKAEVWV